MKNRPPPSKSSSSAPSKIRVVEEMPGDGSGVGVVSDGATAVSSTFPSFAAATAAAVGISGYAVGG